MNNKYLISILTVLLMACNNNVTQKKIDYPQTRTDTITDSYFGEQVADPYRWLEDDLSQETAEWVKAQNEVTSNYLSQIPYREDIKKQLEEIWNYERIGSPFKEGKYTYYFKNNGLQNQSVLYRTSENGDEEVFIDPNLFSEDGTTSLGGISFSRDGSLMGFSISEGGSDWRKIIVLDAQSKKVIGDTLIDVKFSGISWQGNDGFYYSSYDKPKGSELSAKTDQHKLYFHKLNTPQKEDKLIFGGDIKRRYVSGNLTEDNRFLVITAANTTYGNELYIKDLSKPDAPIVNIVNNYETSNYILDNRDDKLFIITDLNAPNKRLVTTNVNQPKPENWIDLISETENVLDLSTGGDYIFAHYMKDALSQVMQYDYNGKLVREIALPDQGTAGIPSGKKEEKTLYYTFTNSITPTTIYSFDVEKGESDLYRKPEVKFDPSLYETKQVFYTSKDSTKVPMIITHKKGIKLNGKNPTLLYGYGGFGASMTPYFSAGTAVWLEDGGIFAVANLRGGGEYGNSWHQAGIKMDKQNVFDDFIAAAEYLISEKYTSSDYLAVQGGSNGGLLVGAVITQRPDLFKAAHAAVGVLDMLRYHTFTAGAGWSYDYGTSEDSPEMFKYLKGYSPLHNVKETKYPATLITTGDHDDRVVPAHSFKFAAELQAKNKGDNPTLIRIETNAGHGAGRSTVQIIEENTDIYSFMFYNMGIKKLK